VGRRADGSVCHEIHIDRPAFGVGTATTAMKRSPSAFAAAAALVLLTSCGNSDRYSGELVGDQRTIEVSVKRFGYDPSIITVREGETVVIKLSSEDVTHGFYLYDYGMTASVDPGETEIIGFVADKAGRFSFRCSVTCGWLHPYEYGYLRVLPNRRYHAGIGLIAIVAAGSLLMATRTRRREDMLFGVIPLNWRFELTKYRSVRTLFKSRWFPTVLVIINCLIFVFILVSGLVGGVSAGNLNFGVMIVWVLWWVLLMALFVPLVGRLWCMVCPFPLVGDWLQRGKLIEVGRQRSWGLNKKWPKRFRNLWPVTAVFFVSTFFFAFFTTLPIATFGLLAVVVLGAIVIALVFEKRTFCLYVCPVSGFQGLYANFAACEVRVKEPAICMADKSKACYLGNAKGYGCPWMELPFDMNRNTYCGLCLECFKTCPNDNMALNLRPFGTDLLTERRRTDDVCNRRGLDEAFKSLTMIGVLVVFFLTMQGPHGWLRDMVSAKTLAGYGIFVAVYTALSFVVVPSLFLAVAYISKLVSGDKEVSLKKVFVEFSYCLVPRGVARWAAFSLAVMFVNGSYILRVISDPLALGWNLWGTASIGFAPFWTGSLPYLQTLMLLAGLAFSLEYGYRFARRTFATEAQAIRGWIPMLLFLVSLSVFFLWLFEG
jgi:polyferredoxin/plastocyanin